jgi:endonuclease YncB( thermonuclease family)
MSDSALNSSKIQAATGLRRHRLIARAVKFICLCAVASILFDHVFASAGARDDWSSFDRQSGKIVSVIDGQTINIRLENSNLVTPVHLLGVASCNSSADERAAKTAPSVGQPVILRLEPTQTRDSQGTLLAYAYLDNRAGSVNVEMVQQGFAILDRRCVCMLSGPIRAAESEARKKRRGLWADPYDVAMPAWRREWTADQRTRREKILAAEAAE